MHKPKISVIIPSYNHEHFIGEAIESVLMQDYTDFELLIADDKSSDNSVDVIKQYTDERIKTFFLTENIGATRILEFLIENASGEYIALINSDDRWCQGKLSKQVEFMENNKDYGACFTWADFIDEESNPLVDDGTLNLDTFMKKNRSQYEWLNWFYFNGNCLCHPSVLIKKSVYKKIGYYNGAYRQLPDFEYWIRLCANYPIHIVEEVLVNHRRTTGPSENTSAVSTDNSLRNISEMINIFAAMFRDFDDEIIIKAFKDDFINKDASSKEEIICEKYFLLKKNTLINTLLKNYAYQFFMDNYLNDAVANCFKEKYNYTQLDFFADNIISIKGYDYIFDRKISSISSSVFYTDQYFSVENSFLVDAVVEDGRFLKLNFNLVEDSKILRVDPIEEHSIIVKNATALVNGSNVEINPLNCEYVDAKHYFFNSDPQYIMHGNFKKGDAVEVTFDIECIINSKFYTINDTNVIRTNEIGNEKFFETVQLCQKIIESKDKEIEVRGKKVEELYHNLDVMREDYEKIIEDLQNTLSWRITKPLRKLRDLLGK